MTVATARSRTRNPTTLKAAPVCLLLLLLSIYAVRLCAGRSINLPSPQCHPTVIDAMPQRIKKICEALTTIWEFSDAMENYLDEKGQSKLNSVYVMLARSQVPAKT
jgi:hypothetical protein